MVANKMLAAFALGGLLLSALFGNPLIIQGLYYFEASVKYSLPIAPVVLFLLLLLYAARQPCASRRSRLLFMLLGWALCFVAAGFSETFDIFMLLALVLLSVLTLLASNKWQRHWLPILASGGVAIVTGILLILSAPGLQDRVGRRIERPDIGYRSIEEILTQTLNAYIDRIGDPAALASISLMLAAGFLVGLTLPKANSSTLEQPGRTPRLPLLLVLVSQLLLLPLLWHHQSDQPILFSRFSAAYSYVIAMNGLLILGAALLLHLQRRGASEQRAVAKAAATAGLAVILLCFTLPQLREAMHWRAYLYLWLSAHSLLILLGWHVSPWLCANHARRFAIGFGYLYFLILAGTAVVALATNMLSVKDIDRTYIFLAHLFTWLGLVWGLALGWSFRSMVGSRKLLAASALFVVVWLTSSIVADNVVMLPSWRQYAAEFDDRLATIIEARANGQRDFVFAPYSFDLTKHLRIGPMHEDMLFMQRYDIDSITLAET